MVLDALGHDKWQNGLCHIFAEALQRYTGKGQIGAIWVGDDFKHVYFSCDGRAYDSLSKDETEEEIWDRWRLKYGIHAELSKCFVDHACDLVDYGVTFGADGSAMLYSGPDYSRWLQEADATISQTLLFQKLKHDDLPPIAGGLK